MKYFDIHEVARLQRLVCREFRDAGQERIHERGGRKLFEEGMAFIFGYDHQIIDVDRGMLLLETSREVGCRLDVLADKMEEDDLSDEEKQKLLKDLKDIATTSPYHWVDYYIGRWYRQGFGGEEKKNQAVAWLEKAAHKGNTRAMRIGCCSCNITFKWLVNCWFEHLNFDTHNICCIHYWNDQNVWQQRWQWWIATSCTKTICFSFFIFLHWSFNTIFWWKCLWSCCVSNGFDCGWVVSLSV